MMKLAVVVVVLCAVLASGVVAADFKVRFADRDSNAELDRVVVELRLVRDGVVVVDLVQFLRREAMVVSADPGRYEAAVVGDVRGTPAYDYLFEGPLELTGEGVTVVVEPVGGLRGVVVDGLDNLVGGASVKVMCAAGSEKEVAVEADRTGGFLVRALPVGECRVSASSRDVAGFVDVEVKQGEVSEVAVVLGQRVKGSGVGGAVFVVGILVVLGAAALVAVLRRGKTVHGDDGGGKASVPVVVVEKTKEELGVGKRLQDVVTTLGEKERAVVDELIRSEGRSSQAKLRYATGIPKTSLARVLEGLRAKRVVEIEKIGKLKKVKLTGWVLEREN